MDVFVRLWVPAAADIRSVESALCDHMMTHNVPPPFTDDLQNEVFRRFGSQGQHSFYRFRIVFPRGPVEMAEHIPSFRMAPPPVAVPYRASMTRNVEPHLRMDPENPFSNPPFIVPLAERGLLIVQRNRRRPRRDVVLDSHKCTKMDTCSVCLETMEIGADVCALPCAHVFHKNCIEQWARRKSTCPMCRREMLN